MWKCDHLRASSEYNSPLASVRCVLVCCLWKAEAIVYFLLLVDRVDPRGVVAGQREKAKKIERERERERERETERRFRIEGLSYARLFARTLALTTRVNERIFFCQQDSESALFESFLVSLFFSQSPVFL